MTKKQIIKATIVFELLLISAILGFVYKAQKSKDINYLPTLDHKTPTLCSDKPNCISSLMPKNHQNYLAPINLPYNPLRNIGNHIPENCTLVKQSSDHHYYACESKLFGFVDDMEFYYDSDEQVLHFISRSRVGYSDLGANKERINSILKFL